MNQIEDGAAEHREIGELLPWFVNGRLSDADRQRVDAHLRGCGACGDELTMQRRIYEVMSVEAGVEHMPMAGLNRLRRRIESLDAAAPAPAPGAPQVATRSEAPDAWSSRQRRGAIAASLAMMVVGAFAALLWNQHERRIAPAYYTVTTTASQPANAAIRAVFVPTVTLSELQALLDEAHLRIVSGPTEAGVYSLAVSGSPSVGWSLQRLRGHDVVRFAESVAPGPVAGPMQ